MAITEVDWIVSTQDPMTALAGSQSSVMAIVGQLTEALSRTTPSLSDPVDVDTYFDELYIQELEKSSVGEAIFFFNRLKAYERHVFRHPWLSVAQQMNLVCSVGPGENAVQDLAEMQFTCRIFFQLIDLSASLRSYLATRLQISGQA